uniref:Proteoglycan 4b n=1 Tax=Echeneis naucrates TaxID=173247 RepID=A0A665W9R6_ECHNA
EVSFDQPAVTTLFFPNIAGVDSATEPTQDYTDLQTSLAPTTPDSSTIGPTVTPDMSTSNPTPGDTGNQSADATASPPSVLTSTSVSSVGPGTLSELDAAISHVPSSTPAVQDDTAENTTPQATTAGPTEVKPSQPTSKPQDKPNQNKPAPTKPSQAKPIPKPEIHINDARDYQADDSNDTNLCSGRPVGAVTTLRNGTIVVFRGHYFWLLDRNGVPGPARGITEVWGVPSPVDTVFTRCNCQSKTYIFKGTRYWRFENDVLDPGYPKAIVTGFDGLRGHITAALSVPQYQRRKESVYFFKRGGLVQRYSYQYGTGSTCGRKPQYTIYTVHNRRVRQAVSTLGPTINIRTSWRGFPSTITAAVSTPDRREPEGYKYYVISKCESTYSTVCQRHPFIKKKKKKKNPLAFYF